MLSYKTLSKNDTDLAEIAASLKAFDWEKSANSVQLLEAFLSDPKNIYIVGYLNNTIAGRAFGHILLHPNGTRSIYIYEVDVKDKFKRHGIGSGLIDEFKKLAKQQGVQEVWVGTEQDNTAALALYRSQQPTEEDKTINFAYEIIK